MSEFKDQGAQSAFALSPEHEKHLDVIGNRTEIGKVLSEMLKIPNQNHADGGKNLRDLVFARLVLPYWGRLPVGVGLRIFHNQDRKVVNGEQLEGQMVAAKSKGMKFERSVVLGEKCMEDVSELVIDGDLIAGYDSISVKPSAKGLKIRNSVIYDPVNLKGEISESIIAVTSSEFWKKSQLKIGRNVYVVTAAGLRHVDEAEAPFRMTPSQRRRVA